MWTEELQDRRDFDILPGFEGCDGSKKLERRMCAGGVVPGEGWILHNLWIDEVCSIVSGRPLLAKRELIRAPPLPIGCLTAPETRMISHWEALALASAAVFLSDDDLKDNGLQTLGLEAAMNDLEVLAKDIPTHDLGFVRSAIVQAFYQCLDYLQAVIRFTYAAQDVNKGRRPGKKTAWTQIDDIQKDTRSSLEDVLRQAGDLRGRMREETVEGMMRGMGVSGTEEAADRYARSARETWDGVLKVKVPRLTPYRSS